MVDGQHSRVRSTVIGVCISILISAVPGAPSFALTLHASPPGIKAGAGQDSTPTLNITRATGPIKVDGELNDVGWEGAARTSHFTEWFPEEGSSPPVESEVWVTYDEDYLYVAFLAYDDPATVRASLRDRDQIFDDDLFGVCIDTYGDAQWAYCLYVNPLGVQGDSRFAKAEEDIGFDVIFYSEGKTTNAGYQIEMAVPFRNLRFPNHDIQTWRGTFWRFRIRESRGAYTWAPIERDNPCTLCQYGVLTGIDGVQPGGGLELLPSLIAWQSGELRDVDDPTSGIVNNPGRAELGLGVRYPFSSGITAELTLNPDFSQVESDAAQIDVNTTFALFFPERRPFFQEGSDLFGTYFDVLYSRHINDPIVAAKLVGRLQRTTFAYLSAVDEHSALLVPFEERSLIGQAGRSFSNVARVRRTFLRDSYVGAIVADRRFHGNGGSGTTGGIDGRIRFLRNYYLAYQILASYTQEPNDTSLTEGINDRKFDRGRHTAAFDGESYWGYAQFVRLARGARLWEFSINYWALSPTFRADIGYEGRNDNRLFRVFQRLNFYPGTWLFDYVSPKLVLWRRWNFDGVRKEDMVAPAIDIFLKGDIRLAFEYVLSRERFSNISFENLKAWSISLRTGFSEVFRPGFSLNHGRWIERFEDPPVSGIGTDAEVWLQCRPLTRWTIEPRVQYSRLENEETGQEFFEGYVLRARTTFQFTRELSLRLVIQYNDFSRALNIEPLVTYKLNPFTMFFVGSTQLYEEYDDPNGFTHTSRQFFAKFQYLIQL